MDDHEPLTAEQVELAAQLWALRQQGSSGQLEPKALPAAIELERRGFAERHRQDGRWLWRFSDKGQVALASAGLLASHEQRRN